MDFGDWPSIHLPGGLYPLARRPRLSFCVAQRGAFAAAAWAGFHAVSETELAAAARYLPAQTGSGTVEPSPKSPTG